MPFVPHLYPVFMKVLQDEDSEVRSNCTYALGVLAEFGGDPIYAYPLVRKKERKRKMGVWREVPCALYLPALYKRVFSLFKEGGYSSTDVSKILSLNRKE